MVTDRVRIDSLEAARDVLGASAGVTSTVLVVHVDEVVPAWLGPLVRAARAEGAIVEVHVSTPVGLDLESAAGWEIGVATAAFAAGADEATGIDPKRVARVREIAHQLRIHGSGSGEADES